MTNLDRIVHGLSADGGKVVRYDRAGKLYLEYDDGRKRRQLKLAEAASLLAAEGATFYPGRYGGTRINAAVNTLLGARRCPTCGMPGWNGINLHRRSYSGCSCCGFCY